MLELIKKPVSLKLIESESYFSCFSPKEKCFYGKIVK